MVQKIKEKFGIASFVIIVCTFLSIAIVVCGLFAARSKMPAQMDICGIDMSSLRFKDAKALLEERISNYSTNVSVGDQILLITADDIDLVFLKDEFDTVIRSSIKMDTEVDPWDILSFDQEKLQAYISLNFDQKRIESVPATVVWDDFEGQFKVIPGIAQSWYDEEKLAGFVRTAVSSLSEELEITEQMLYKELDNTKQFKTAEALAVQANELLNLEQEYVFAPRKMHIGQIVIDRNMIASFLRVDSVNETIDVDRDAVYTYAESIFADYDYFKREDCFVTHDGERVDIKVPIQEQTVDIQAFAALITENILNGISGSFEVPYSGEVNFDGSYVEVSIPQQRLWVYMDGEVVLESDIVSGNRGTGKRSPTGLYCIRGHLRDIYLMDAYFVNYWMTITLGGRYGFHDADGWRSPDEYGGDTYKYNGSGGCINVPGEKIAIMYDLVPDTTPVVIYNEFYFD